MKILVLLGSPRKNGNSQTLSDTVIAGIKETTSCTVDSIYLHGLKDIHPCRGCGGCEKTGMCVIKDDMIEIYNTIDAADLIFAVTPVYFYGPSAQIKTCIDRCQARWSRKYLLQQRVRRDEKRRGVLLATAATKGAKVFDATMLIAKSFFDTIDVDYGGELVIRSVDEKKALAGNEEDLEHARQFGRDIAAALS